VLAVEHEQRETRTTRDQQPVDAARQVDLGDPCLPGRERLRQEHHARSWFQAGCHWGRGLEQRHHDHAVDSKRGRETNRS
jgi:hypothetical protein